MSWPLKRVEEIADFCLGKMLDEKKNKGEPLPYLANVNVRWGEFDLSDLRQMKFETDELERFSLKYGDIVMCEGGEPGRCAIWKERLPGMMFQKALHRIRSFRGIDQQFLYYSFLYKGKRGGFSSLYTGSTIKHLPKQQLAKVEIAIPPFDIQKRISMTLSTYDDLIENNKRRIALLEESARLLYKEWFVRFRFPGHEHVKIVDGVPEGWLKGTVGNIAKVFSGYAFKSNEWLDEGNPVIKIKNITSNNTVDVSDCQCVDNNVAEKTTRFKLGTGDMLIAMTGATVGKVGLMPSSEKSHYLNQRVGKFVSNINREVTPLLLPFFNSEKVQASILNLAGGAAQPNISAKQIESIEMPVPPNTLLDVYLDETEKIFELRLNLIDQNFKLTKARDLLLPKLMNGEIAV